MTDFFTRMAQRAIGAAPAIQPVVVSRYARVNQVAASPYESEVGVVSNTGEQMNNAGKRPSLPPGVPNSSPPPAMTESASEFEPEAALSLADLETNRATPEHELQPPIPGAFSELPADLKDSPLSDRISYAPSTDSPVQTVRAVFSSASEKQSLPIAGPVISQPPQANIDGVETNARGSGESDRAHDHRSALEPESIFRSDDETRRPQREQREPELTAPALERGAANSAESFPVGFKPSSEQSFASRAEFVEENPSVIRVTIGRIEVRAVKSAPPQRQDTAPPGPKISLDEFLRQHNGRRR